MIAVTSGEPSGIGPDICLALARHRFSGRIVVLGDRRMLDERARRLELSVHLDSSQTGSHPQSLVCLHMPLAVACRAGAPDPRNAPYVLELIKRAAQGCLSGEFDAIVTAPVNKGVMNDAGIQFMGHTEYLAKITGAEQVVMMLVGGGLRVALATTHLALKDVPGALTRAGLDRVVRILLAGLRTQFGISCPRVLVSGLNPHGGEGGHFGKEELEVICPVLENLRHEGLDVEGPVPADTLFVPTRLAEADCVLTMYHDQGLPVLKYASFGKGVNVTLGLPIVRTSVDHGTAFDLAGSGAADPGSLFAAVELAIDMARARASAKLG